MTSDQEKDFKTQLRVSAELPKGAQQGAKVSGFSRLYKTGQSHEYIIMPKDMQPDEAEDTAEDLDAVFQDQAPAPAAKPRRTRKKAEPAAKPQDTKISVQVDLPGFGSVPTKYTDFDVGDGCLRLGICEESWIPPRAERDDDGKLAGGFAFVSLPDRKWLNIGLEFTSKGRRNIVLIET